MEKGHERRKFNRKNLIYYLEVFDMDSGEVLGRLVDITPEGLMLIAENPVPLQKVYNLKMVLPREISGKKELEFSGQCRWSRKDINPEYYVSGFHLLDITRDEQLIIEIVIDGYGFF